ncbi:TRAP transporter substrate-binding protein [Salipaludibacillus sp. CF4.18]|uniref:TRAP transporter substrate-binding protein n=1 Tax=Salipaludibacillus sp. CF4.18 TaxID=3373081 RepID=UPI003EE8179D
MKNYNKAGVFLVIGAVAVLAAACGDESSTSSESENGANNQGNNSSDYEVSWRYHNPLGEHSPPGIYADRLAEGILEQTDGRINIDVYHNAELGGHEQTLQSSSTGSIEMGLNDISNIATLYPDLGVYGLPYVYEDIDHGIRAFESDQFNSDNEGLVEATNLRVLGIKYYGSRQLTANQEILSPEDAEGIQIRAQNSISQALVEGLGGTPASVDFTELSTALATNVVGGQENPVGTILDHHFYESQDYLMMTNHQIAFLLSYINEEAWNSISEEDQAIIEDVLIEARDWSVDYVSKEEEEAIEELRDNGMNIITGDEGLQLDEFQFSVEEVLNEKFPEWQEAIENIKEM